MTELRFTHGSTVRLVQHCGGDHSVVAAAKVSTSGDEAVAFAYGTAKNDKGELWSDKDSFGLINYLMKHRHGCYDSKTEVLTDKGWKRWPDVDGGELFVTLSPNGVIEYQKAERLVRKTISGPMILIQGQGVDLCVTPDHNMLACRRKSDPRWGEYSLVPARDFLEAPHKIKMGGGRWGGTSELSFSRCRLLGFFIGDGCYSGSGNTCEFNLKRERKIDYLHRACQEAGLDMRRMRGTKYSVSLDMEMRRLLENCYNDQGDKKIPHWVLGATRSELRQILDGLVNSDGSVSSTGRVGYSTTSEELANQIQELTLKCGVASVWSRHDRQAGVGGHYGNKASYRMTIYRKRNLRPSVGCTLADRIRQVRTIHYDGQIHCVTVPNGTLYVRRNGKPCWCGNTPFEHALMTFFVRAPIFVWREWHRHRIGFSYNEESGRYKQLEPEFYLPPTDRPMFKVEGWKPGRPKFLPINGETGKAAYNQLVRNLTLSYQVAYEQYEKNLGLGIDPGLARDCLPVGIFSSCWVSCNPRSLMAFLSLRTNDEAAKFVSYPLFEIEECARKVEELFTARFPQTHKAFVDNGRVAP